VSVRKREIDRLVERHCTTGLPGGVARLLAEAPLHRPERAVDPGVLRRRQGHTHFVAKTRGRSGQMEGAASVAVQRGHDREALEDARDAAAFAELPADLQALGIPGSGGITV